MQCGPREAFSGRISCGAGYGTDDEWETAIQIEDFPEDGEKEATTPPPWNPAYTDHEQATVNQETRAGSKILHHRGPQYSCFYWHSGTKHVEVFFYKPIPQRDQIVAFYLSKYPSSFR